MKYATLFLLCLTAYSQNPDGNGLSVQITPYYTFGKIESTVRTNYPYYNSNGTFISYRNILNSMSINKDESFNYSLVVKYPMSRAITVSLFYQSFTDGFTTDFAETNRNTPLSLTTQSTNTTKSIGGTITFYFAQ